MYKCSRTSESLIWFILVVYTVSHHPILAEYTTQMRHTLVLFILSSFVGVGLGFPADEEKDVDNWLGLIRPTTDTPPKVSKCRIAILIKQMWGGGGGSSSTANTLPVPEDCTCVQLSLCDDKNPVATSSCEMPDEVCCKNVLDTQSAASPTNVDWAVCGTSNNLQPTTPQAMAPQFKVDVPVGVDGNTTYGEFPWMVAIYKRSPSGNGYEFECGGSIIQPNVILTAAHSISDIAAGDLLVKAGTWNLSSLDEKFNHQNGRVQRVVVHPEFNKEGFANDFALLIIEPPFEIKDAVNTVCLPSSERKIDETSCIATGWGGTDKNGNSKLDTLKKVKLPLIRTDRCQQILKAHNFNLHNSYICAGGSVEGDTCYGDGGGPLMCALEDNPDQYVQVGITSFGFDCGSTKPGGYSSVEFAADWIDKGIVDSTVTPKYKGIVIK